MPLQLTPFVPTLIYLVTSTPLANASSFQFTPLLQTFIGGILAIVGSLITGYFLIKSHKKTEMEKKKLEVFGEILEKVYAPFQEIAEEIINQNKISYGNRAKLKDLIDQKKKFLLMCPEDIKKEIGNLRENLREEDYIEAIKRVKAIKGKIDALIDTLIFKK